jgi:hypothetical protein
MSKWELFKLHSSVLKEAKSVLIQVIQVTVSFSCPVYIENITPGGHELLAGGKHSQVHGFASQVPLRWTLLYTGGLWRANPSDAKELGQFQLGWGVKTPLPFLSLHLGM